MKQKKQNRKSRAKGIAETYIHINIQSKNLEVNNILTKEKATIYLEQHAIAWAEKFYGKKINVQIKVEEGSIKAYVLVAGLSIFEFVSNYGSFRSGIDQIVDDSKSFSEYVINNFMEDENISDDMIIRNERRLGIPGKIQRFLKQAEKLDTELPVQKRNDLIESLSEELLEILLMIDNHNDREIFKKNSPELIVNTLPLPLPEPLPSEHYEKYTLLNNRELNEEY